MAELKELLEGCTATDVAGIEAYVNEQMKTRNVKMFLDDGVKDIFIPKSRLDGALIQLHQAQQTLVTQTADIAKLGELTKDNIKAQETITGLQTKVTESGAAMQKLAVQTAIGEKAKAMGFIAPAEDLIAFIKSENLKVNDDGTVTGIDEQLTQLKQAKPYLISANGNDGTGDAGGNGVGDNSASGNEGAAGGTGDPGKANNNAVFGSKGYKAGQFGQMMGKEMGAIQANQSPDSFYK